MRQSRHRQTGPLTLETIDFQVIGELRDSPQHLLLLGDDGQCYRFDIGLDRITPLDPADSWSVDVLAQASLHLEPSIQAARRPMTSATTPSSPSPANARPARSPVGG